MEKYLVLIAELGAACAVLYAGLTYFFKNSFRDFINPLIQPLKEALDRLSYNVNQQTEMQKKQVDKLEALEHVVDLNTQDIIKHEEQIKTLFNKENFK